MKFYNRQLEIAELQRIRELSFNDSSRMTVVTGRRRIGKTYLIQKALGDSNEQMLYFFVAKKAQAPLVKEFAEESRGKLGIYIPIEITTFQSLFKLIFEAGRTQKFTLVVDEFQDFLAVAPSFISDLQNLWDQYRRDTHINLVLSGSVMSMMEKIFKDSHEPLFGRADNIIALKPFKIKILKEILGDYNPGYAPDDLLALYSITGGIPKYIELLCDNGATDKESMLEYFCSPMSPFLDEGKNLLINEIGKDFSVYFSILQLIAEGKSAQNEIEEALGGLSVGGYIDRLENVYRVIKRYQPIFAKPRSRNTVKYRLADNFLQFWFRFVEHNRSLLERDRNDLLAKIVNDEYPTYSGHLLEKYFRQKLGEEGDYREIGQWWEPRLGLEASEIDIVAIGLDKKSALVGEVKRQRRNYDHKLFMKKVETIKNKILGKYDISTRLFTLKDM